MKVFCYHSNKSTILLSYSIFRTTPEVSSKLYFVEICQVSEKLWLFNHKRADFWLPNFGFKISLLSLFNRLGHFNQAVLKNSNFENLAILNFSSLWLCFRRGLRCYIECEKVDYLCNCKSEISNVCNSVESHCLQAMKIVHHHANCRFDWFISEHQTVNPS